MSFIFTTILLDCLGIGVIIPTLPDVVRRLASDPTIVNDFYGYFMAAYAVMQFFASPVLGSLSDKYGRRPILLISLCGGGLDYLMMAFAPNLIVLFIGRMISGLSGASFTVATSYIADVSDDSNRSANFGLIGAAFGIGFIIGPLAGGVLGQLGPSVPFIGAAVLNLANFAFGYFILPESLPPESRRAFGASGLNPFHSLKKVLRPSPILLLIFAYGLMNLSGLVHPSIWVLYSEHRYGWTSIEVGISLAFVGLSAVVVQGWLVRLMIPKLGEERALKIGVLIELTSYLLYAIASKGWMVYPILAFGAFSGLSQASMRSLISKDTPPQEQGELQGSLTSITSLMSIVAPLLYTQSFDWAVKHDFSSGMPYFFAAAISMGTMIFVLLRKVAPLGEAA
jgi:MFS transporter, DHA1 family, tetracycline resistance protein